ncbi:cytochrome P460 family protein [Alterinioella nitratireducens]|uniref:cytochrome P460 family protein n=1 Tax=Alterinioella nitratireducens TaxID=2735915 RepID=UPI0015542AD2|nr:cytochrome P460 family protein [Alterinioella nitratireducens]NPD21472.1 hypothetical protein [Alterinioella nitratireducens]
MLNRLTRRHTILSIVLVGSLASPASSEPNRVEFPENLDELEHYTTVTRGEVTEFMYTSQAALDAIQAGEPVPYGTQVILQDWRDDEVYRLFVMQKGEGWGDEYDEAVRTGDWQFQWYWPDGSINMDENTDRCRACHQAREGREYMFTFNDARRAE